ncbi:MAG: DUF4145 domain-containing protein [Bacteroidales bacterium]|nr:DUF4145 domain-containing protein [Bacteroidales bacterium]
MKLLNKEEFEKYILNNYKKILSSPNLEYSRELAQKCNACNRDVFLKVYTRAFQETYHTTYSYPRFITFFVECPSCRRKSFIQAVQLNEEPLIQKAEGADDETKLVYNCYELYRLPISEENWLNNSISEEHTSLRNTVIEANYCLAHSKFIAAAILFRRALQIIAKDVLGAKGKTLFLQLEWLKSNKNSLDIDLTEVFHENSELVKNIGNQGAHPDKDVSLHEFTENDAKGLHDLFISVIHEIFVKPKKTKALQEELKRSRKLT